MFMYVYVDLNCWFRFFDIGILEDWIQQSCHEKVEKRHLVCPIVFPTIHTWWLIPLSKWVITPVISGLTLLIPFITGVITHLLSGMRVGFQPS